MRNLVDRFDHSPRVAERIKWLSARLARQRGLPVAAAIFLTVLSLVVHLALVLAPNSVLLMLCGLTLLHVAIIVGLVGVLLAEPVGRG